MTVGDLIKLLQQFDQSRMVNIVDGSEMTQPNGSKTTELAVSAVEGVFELENGCIGIVTPAGYRIGKDDDL